MEAVLFVSRLTVNAKVYDRVQSQAPFDFVEYFRQNLFNYYKIILLTLFNINPNFLGVTP